MLHAAQIQSALKKYDREKGQLDDHSAVAKLKKLSDTKQGNLFEIILCFIQTPYKTLVADAAHEVYLTALNLMSLDASPSVFHTLSDSGLLTKENFDVIKNYPRPESAFSVISMLKEAGLLIQENFDVLNSYYNFTHLVWVLSLLKRAGLLTQANFDVIKIHTNFLRISLALANLNIAGLLTQENFNQLDAFSQSFLFASEGLRIVWEPIPRHLWTQDLLLEFIEIAQQPNPGQALQRRVNQLLGLRQAGAAINNSQSTHTASVHQSVSESATLLANRYQRRIDGASLENTLQEVQTYLSSLSDSPKNKAAKQGFLRIVAPDYTFTDHSSQVTTKQLLALTFLAIHDHEKRIGSLEDAQRQFIEALYKIQRGYNLSELGIDQGGDDRPICAAGTFNKLIEKLQGIHPDCRVLYITKATASLKLPIVVREEAIRYLASLANPSTTEALLTFTHLMAQIKEHGVEVIWDRIKNNIAKRMFDEFDSFYRDRTDPDFIALVEAGKDVELADLSLFQKQVQGSKGYQQYCSQQIRFSARLFYQSAKLGEPSQDSPESQQGYRCRVSTSC